MTPELIGILAMGGTLAGLMLALWRDTRADIHALRADNHALRAEVRADNQSLREELRADIQVFRQEVRADLVEVKTDVTDLRKDVQSLTERTSRLEGVIEGLFGGRDRREDAA